MSGGADSAFSAYLLRRAGHEVVALFALLAQEEPEREVQRVQRLCTKLRIPLEVVDLRQAFQEKIIAYFKEAYQKALTPNPCVLCNREIKFGLLLQEALRRGAEKLATGHYVRLYFDSQKGCYFVKKGRDQGKDQSYFLALLGQEQLSRALFPLGEWIKEEVIKETLKLGLFEITAPESQEVCFIRGDYRQLFRDDAFPPGEIVTVSGRVVGKHRGLYAYTIGQRRGLGVRLGRPYYVVALDPEKNQVVIGTKKHLARREVLVQKLHRVCPRLPWPEEAWVRIRYRHREARAKLYPLGEEGLRLVFHTSQKAITPGQFAVIYQDDLVLGGGEIQRTKETCFEPDLEPS